MQINMLLIAPRPQAMAAELPEDEARVFAATSWLQEQVLPHAMRHAKNRVAARCRLAG